MQRFDLNQNWEYLESSLQNPLMVGMLQGWKKTSLPHDYAVEKARSPEAATGLDEGFMACAGLYYRKSFTVEPEIIGQRFWLEFEGIAGITEVWLNKKPITKHNNPYTGFWVEVTNLLQAGDNEITVYTDNRTKPNSRWYVGCGIYRSVWLHMAGAVSAAPHGIRAVTAALDGSSAVVEVSTALTGTADSVTYELVDAEGQVLATAEGLGTVQLAANGFFFLYTDTTEIYTLRVTVTANGTADTTEQRIGIRTIQVSSKTGLLLNGQPRTMKGGCIHHDLGILGAADHAAAERRRIRLMKESGFDAIRAAHNPFGPAFLDACDELGMLVVEEAFDEWVMGRTSFGLHVTFEQCWEKDLEDMITRDYNHPCIVMWSTGNEVEERDGTADGFAWAKRLADKVRSLDASHPVSATACALFSEYGNRPAGGTTGNQALNMAYDTFAEGRDIWGPGTAPYFAPLDVAGYNYKVARYAYDAEKYPDRVIYGSESYPRAALLSWQGARDNVNVIGDFVWTAWDYIGEVGVGRWEVSAEPRPSQPAWPWLTANCGDFDLLGRKRPQSYYRDVIWGNAAPHIFCLPPELVDKHLARLSWAWLPVQRNYTFPGCEGQDVEVNIYADADEVELLLNGRSLGRKPCTEAQEYLAVFRFAYEPGTLEAVSYKNGVETGRDTLATASKTAALRLTADRPAIAGAEVQYVPLVVSTDHVHFVDDETLDVRQMLDTLSAHKGRSYTACPSVDGWLTAFDGGDEIYAVTITSALSGSYNAAMAARELYLQEHPGAKVAVFDSLSTGPELRLILEKLRELTAQGLPFEQVEYWQELCRIMEWTKTHVHSTLHICWGAQAALYYHYGVQKELLPEKLFGVFRHRVVYKNPILLRGFDDEFWVPHSRHTTVRREDVEAIPEIKILAASEEAGLYAMSTQYGHQLFITGHSEYDPETLNLEYLRDRNAGMEIQVPKNYFPDDDDTQAPVVRWRGHANLLYSNWLNYIVYQTVPYDVMAVGRGERTE